MSRTPEEIVEDPKFDPDDELMSITSPEVIDILGVDPLELFPDEETVDPVDEDGSDFQ